MDPITGAALIGGAANLIGGIMGASGQSSANRQNIALAREQMAFQERMSSTAYQRAAKDLEAAGLSRVLALGGAATTPVGARGQIQSPGAAKQRALEQAVANTLQLSTLRQNLRNLEAQEMEAHSRTDLNRANEDLVAEDIQNRRQLRQTEIARYANLMADAVAKSRSSAYVLEQLPGQTAEANLWRALNRGNLDQAAKAIGMSVPALRAALTAARMLRMGSR
jgi:hypothetical protein